MNDKQQKARRGTRSSTQGSSSPMGMFTLNEMPKSFLEAWLLLMLRTWGGHGYALAENMTRMGFFGIDHTRIYRQLRDLEKRGFLLSSWEAASFGPAKRVYKVTAAGEQFLSVWAHTLQGYSKMMEAFTSMYTGAFSAPPTRGRTQEGSADQKGKEKQEDTTHG